MRVSLVKWSPHKSLSVLLQSKGALVINSSSYSPFHNLSLEPTLLQLKRPVLYLYVNKPCIVFGRNQIPFREINLPLILDPQSEFSEFSLVRRLSGGGTVGHDLGNLNYAFFTPVHSFSRKLFPSKIIEWLTNFHKCNDLNVTNRGDIFYKGAKVGGSAFRISRGWVCHHGTLLVNSNLDDFRKVLRRDDAETNSSISWLGGSVDSVRSNISNLPSSLQNMQFVTQLISKGFIDSWGADAIELDEQDILSFDNNVKETYAKLTDKNWIFNTGPQFVLSRDIDNLKITVQKGIIKDCNLPSLIDKSFLEWWLMQKEAIL